MVNAFLSAFGVFLALLATGVVALVILMLLSKFTKLSWRTPKQDELRDYYRYIISLVVTQLLGKSLEEVTAADYPTIIQYFQNYCAVYKVNLPLDAKRLDIFLAEAKLPEGMAQVLDRISFGGPRPPQYLQKRGG